MSWIEDLECDAHDLKAWYEDSGSPMSFEYHAIKKGIVSEPDFLEWAQNTYHLPVLDPSFLERNCSPELALVKKHPKNPWNQEFVPIYEWDNVIFVACLTPPEVRLPGVQYVLSTLSALELWWDKFQFHLPIELQMEDTNTKELNRIVESIENEKTEPFIHLPKDPKDQPKKNHLKLGSITGEPPYLEIAEDKNREGMSKIIRSTYSRLSTHTEKVMLILCTDQIALPWKWSKAVNYVSEDSLKGYSLGIPSMLRIVSKTLKPYHGFIVDNAFHRQFYHEWCEVDLPGWVTIFPVTYNDELAGMVLAYDHKISHPEDFFHCMEKVSHDWTQFLNTVLEDSPLSPATESF